MQISRRDDANAASPLPPRAFAAKSTGMFEGNDGKWSTFWINVGSDGKSAGQEFRVLISTSSSLIVLPRQAEWCDQDCAAERGVEKFNAKQPRGLVEENNWKRYGIYEIKMPHWYTRDFLGSRNDTPAALWGVQNVALDRSSPQAQILADRWVAQSTSSDFYMGSFGLAVGAIDTAGVSKKTFLSELDASQPQLIASSSYGYTAGAIYRNDGKGVPGSLVFGGYDKSRLTDDGVSISMPSSSNTTLAVGINSLTYKAMNEVGVSSFTEGGFDASIDSTFPYLVLPDSVCDRFVEKFGLGYDKDRKLYTVNSTSHDLNKRNNATLTFKVAKGAAESLDFANIVLPYAAFDLEFRDPENSTSERYFPIKKSENSMYVLGRSFLQEAYIVVDYERANFTVAPAYFSDTKLPEDLKTILGPDFVPSLEPSTPETSGDKLPTGAVAGIVVGIVVAFIIAGLALFCFWKKRRNAKQTAEERGETSEIDTALADSEIKRRRVSELTGSETIVSPKSPLQDYWSVDHKSVPPISEMSPDSPPAELYSPPAESASDRESRDYFTAGKARRHNSGHNTPGTPAIAELPGDEGEFYTPRSELEAISPIQGTPKIQGGLSDASLTTNIDERIAEPKKSTEERKSADDAQESAHAGEAQFDPTSTERRPSHTRGLSDTTVHSDTTVVSQPTPEEEERWAREPRRPLSE